MANGLLGSRTGTKQKADGGVPPNQINQDLWRLYRTFLFLAMLGFIGAFLYAGSQSATIARVLATFGGALLLAGAFGFVGGLIGFVFAIPRSRQEQGATRTPAVGDDDQTRVRLSDYAANTNLEQISDWLTKILVGISLVQFSQLSDRWAATATSLAPMLGDGAGARPVALSLMTYFTLWGFFFAYLSTRLWLPKALSRAERDERRDIENEGEMQAVERQAYEALYQGAPGGFTRAIDAIENYHAKPGSLRSPWLWTYLASAYGQKHAYEQDAKRQKEADAAKEKAVAAVAEALKLGPETRPILEQLYRGTDPNENDLVTLHDDHRLDELLGGATNKQN